MEERNKRKYTLYEKIKLGKQTPEYKRRTLIDRNFSAIIGIVILVAGYYYIQNNGTAGLLGNSTNNALGNDITGEGILNNIQENAENIKKANSENSLANVENLAKTNGELRVYYIDVGQADSILVMDQDKTMLIDAGNNDDGDMIVNFLKNKGITKIDYLVGTHPHEDHIGGLDNVINNFEIGTLYMPRQTTTTKTYEDVLNAVAKKGIKITVPKVNDEFVLNKAKCKVLAVDTVDDPKNLNLSSIVIRMTYIDNSFLFTGDAEKEVEESRTWPTADVLKVGHHGSLTSSTENFLNQVRPSIAIISVGKDNSYGLPKQQTIDKLNKINSKIYRTDESGTVLVITDGQNIKVGTEK